ncbi:MULTISPECIES: ATP-binding protein [unclassified Okeania]|nr:MULTISPECIES: ATP-binding protein [unclassified Okeania]NES79788.1 GAF domain-containing protein [Okeania sp. SIO1H4]NET14615.1 GAF domain-containing protein [Okeania sp. SIO1H6]NET97224.1 GAF domain-containing protein [Okeania sp. SIO1H2]
MIGTHKDISDRKAAEVTLKQQLELEKLVANISTSFIKLNPNEINNSIQIALKQLCELIDADRSYMFLISSDRLQVSNTHQWRATKTEAKIEVQQNFLIDYLPWIMEKLNKFEVVHIPLVSNLPLEASREKRILSAQSIQSLLCIPMVSGDELIGLVGSEYIHALIDNLFCSYGDRESQIKPIIHVEAIALNLETAIPCGLLINELVTNSLKHAFPNNKSGEICIELYQDQQEKVYFTIKDNGIGIPPGFDWQNSSSLGLKLVQIISKQLKAEINFDSCKGTVVNLRFYPLNYKSRF